MKLVLSIACLLVAIGVATCQPQFTNNGGGSSSNNGNNGSSGRCTRTSADFKDETKKFLNCIQSKIEYEIHRYKVENAQAAFDEQSTRVRGAFNARCTMPQEADNPSREKLKSFLVKLGFSANIGEFVEAVSDVIWTAAENDGFTKCFLGYIRERFLRYVSAQTGASIPVNELDGLNTLPTFNNPGKKMDWKKAEKSVNQMLIAALKANQCGADGKSVLKALNKKTYEDVCHCKKTRYDDCTAAATSVCPDVNAAIIKILDDPSKVMTKKHITDKALDCFAAHKGNGDLAAKGIRLQNVFGKLSDSDLDKMGNILSALVNSFFTNEFCSAQC